MTSSPEHRRWARGATEAASAIRAKLGQHEFDIAIALGSSWSAASDSLSSTFITLQMRDIPGFSQPRVAGHPGVIRWTDDQGPSVLIFEGRLHLYEGHPPARIVHWVRTADALGCRIVIVTNAAGSLRREWPVGSAVLISDQLNLTGESSLAGASFVDMSTLYSLRLRSLARKMRPTLAEGVYAGVRGPQYETPAEVKMLRGLGADLVGMSTVLEALAAREIGAELLGISLVTNLAAGLNDRPIEHREVLEVGKSRASDLGRFLAELIGAIGREGILLNRTIGAS